ncbi:unnamed protein product [Schistosoma curassoni]|uniref:WXG100 family type VII secretion target n=1 Tax=Schistosoma curassoni TaxID=6186 RepID=A0A183JS84_9TREM|nr:unnamed protein product [Schistosoma curassoni]
MTTGDTALQRFNRAPLRNTDKLNEFKMTLNNRFQALQDLLGKQQNTMKENWNGIKEKANFSVSEGEGPQL